MHLGSGIKAEDCGRNGVGSTEVINLSELSSPQTQRHLLLFSVLPPPASLTLLFSSRNPALPQGGKHKLWSWEKWHKLGERRVNNIYVPNKHFPFTQTDQS